MVAGLPRWPCMSPEQYVTQWTYPFGSEMQAKPESSPWQCSGYRCESSGVAMETKLLRVSLDICKQQKCNSGSDRHNSLKRLLYSPLLQMLHKHRTYPCRHVSSMCTFFYVEVVATRTKSSLHCSGLPHTSEQLICMYLCVVYYIMCTSRTALRYVSLLARHLHQFVNQPSGQKVLQKF